MSSLSKNNFYFVNGGWVMQDEAIPDYRSVIEGMSTGQQFLYDTFKIIPKVGWQVDSFGETAVTPSVYSMLGIEALVNSKIGYSVKETLKSKESLNFIWEGHKIGEDMNKHRIFTHPTINGYQIPQPFDFAEEKHIHCMEPYIDKKYSRAFFEQVIQPHIGVYDKSDDIAIVFGADNLFQDAYSTFYCIDNYMAEIQRLVRHWTNYKWISYKFATIDEYLDQIQKVYNENQWRLPYIQGDMIPYDQRIKEKDLFNSKSKSEYSEFWTGYYSTQPVIKQQIRDMFHDLRVLTSVYTINHLAYIENGMKKDKDDDSFSQLTTAKRDASRMLHHDTISGTHPKNTYKLDFNKTITETNSLMTSLLAKKHLDSLKIEMMKPKSKFQTLSSKELQYYLEGEISDDLYPITLFNPSLQERVEVINITVEGIQAAIFNENLESVKSQLVNSYTLDIGQNNTQTVEDESLK